MCNSDRIFIVCIVSVGGVITTVSLLGLSYFIGIVGAYCISYVEHLRAYRVYISHLHTEALLEDFQRTERKIQRKHNGGHVFGEEIL